jgi:hypothetical protein
MDHDLTSSWNWLYWAMVFFLVVYLQICNQRLVWQFFLSSVWAMRAYASIPQWCHAISKVMVRYQKNLARFYSAGKEPCYNDR